MPSFDPVVDEYDAARPGYPEGVYDALGPLDGAVVLDGGAGTGIASGQLLGRGAAVIAVDIGASMLRRAVQRRRGVHAVVADGARLPMRDGCVELVCFAQSWHWLDAALRVPESARVLTPGGRWAAWWSHARADGQPWFEESWAAIESACPGTKRGHRDIDWGEDLARSGRFAVSGRQTFDWVREVTADDWLTDQRSHSYVAGLEDATREMLLDQLASIVQRGFPGGDMTVPYQTWLWTARLL